MRVRRLTLRWRVAAAVGLGALPLTGIQAEVNVRLVDRELRSGGEGLEDLLTGLTTGTESSVLLRGPQGWMTSGRGVSPEELPKPLLALAEDGVPARQR